nr:glycosyltransferase [Campylobacterota bacterium]
MKATVIVAIYKDIEALNLILNALLNQTYTGDYEVIIAEDGSDADVKAFMKSLSTSQVLHTTQKDEGWQKNKSINNALKIAKGELIIFLDGDCIPYSNFIENYLQFATPKTVLAGRRVELGPQYSYALREKEIDALDIENNYFKYYFNLKKDNTRRYEVGIKLNN